LKEFDNSLDSVMLEGMTFFGFHGVHTQERNTGQYFIVRLKVYFDLSKAGFSDDLNDTINYSDLYGMVKQIVEGQPRNLLEFIAQDIATKILDTFPVSAVCVRVMKPSPPIKDAILGGAGVEVYRQRDLKD
jgi:dihydroneopterin aldolase